MASKQSQRGQRVQREPPRWNEDSIRRFEEVQRRKRERIKCDEIAEWCSELDDSAVPNEAARENAYAMLRRDLINGRFGLHVRLVFPKASIRKRMTNKWFRNATEHSYDGERGDLWLKNCW